MTRRRHRRQPEPTTVDDPTLDADLAAWNAPGWTRLPLDDKDFEVLLHLYMKPAATMAQRGVDLWPGAHLIGVTANFQHAVERINAAATAATGKPGPIIATPGFEVDARVTRPELRLRLMTDRPYADVR